MTTKKKRSVVKRKTPIDRLYDAAAAYIKSEGGTAIVAAGTQIMRWPGDPETKYTLCIPIVGRAPVKK